MARYRYRIPMRWADMDSYRHVNNVVFLRYLEEARVNMMFVLSQTEVQKSLREGVVIARHEIDYKRPLVWQTEPVYVDTWVTRLRAARVELAYEVIDDDDVVYARAASVLVPYSLEDQRPRRMTAEEHAYLSQFTEGQALAGS